MNSLNTSIKHNLTIGILTSIWIFIFAFFVRPFDDGSLNLKLWFLISTGFSLAAFLSYGLLTIIQKKVYSILLKWNLFLEITSLVFFYTFYLICVYSFYKSIITPGYNLIEFITLIFYKAALIYAPIFFIARRYIIKLIPKKDNIIIIKGENKLDILKIEKSDLICISNSFNYVEIFFVENNQLKTKVIRTSLKKIKNNFSFLIQIHRSHLINPTHFKSWKNKSIISLTYKELPVSKNYKEALLSL